MSELAPPWKQRLSRSLHVSRARPESRYLQLATAAKQGPQVRTVVFRGFSNDGHHLAFITDTRSQKYKEIAENPNVAACWYFAKSREQYRFNGRVTIFGFDTDISQEAWKNLSAAGKQQFTWGEPLQPILQPRTESFLEEAEINDASIPEHFCVMHIVVREVDYLNLKAEFAHRPQLRERYIQSKTGWECQPVIP
jgi:PPOX class probable FMN-dependent enzyme